MIPVETDIMILVKACILILYKYNNDPCKGTHTDHCTNIHNDPCTGVHNYFCTDLA